MHQLRGLFTATVFLGMVALTLASAFEVVRRGLPQPFDIRTVRLTDWLTERNMRQQGRSMKRRIIAEIERQSAAGHDWRHDWETLPLDDRQRFAANWHNLTALWLRDQMEKFFRTEEDQRDAYLDQQLARIKRWWLPPMEPVESDEPAPIARNRRSGMMRELDSRWDQIFKNFEPHESQRTKYYFQLVQMRGINRAFTPSKAEANERQSTPSK